MEFDTFPDSEAIASKILRDAGICSGRVYSSIPKKGVVWPLAVVKRVGGTPTDRRALDTPRIQVDIWGENKAQARDEAEAARVALHSAEGTTFTELAGRVTGVEDDLGLQFLPDPETARDRYFFAVRLSTRSAAA